MWGCEQLRLGKPSVETGVPLEPLAFRAPLWEMRQGDTTIPQRLTWSIPHRRKTPLVVSVRDPEGGALPARGLLLLNDTPIEYFDRAGVGPMLIDADQLSRGTNVLQLALLPDVPSFDGLIEPIAELEDLAKAFAGFVKVGEAVENLTEKAEWAFARWEVPPPSAFEPGRGTARTHHQPTWWKSSFKTPASPEALYLDVSGLTKGQLYLNGRHLGPYFAGTGAGRAVGPQTLHLLPSAWMVAGGENDLLIFDEHGAHPTKARLAFGAIAPVRASV
jgi:hypothetical protein